jgi:dTDP-4-dehydrorhamnose reductase
VKILLLGKNGQVGWELQRALAPLGELVALDRRDAGGDLLQPEAVAQRIAQEQPQWVVNAAAYTAVDKAESDVAAARCVNAQAVAAIAKACQQTGAKLVHYSTDYVFDGSGEHARSEEAPTAPLSVYGQTKLEGEQAIAASACAHLLFRTSWVYAARGGNFAKTMLRLAQEKTQLAVVQDQWGAPTGAELIADVTAQCMARFTPAHRGTYHLVAAGETCWLDYARHVIEVARTKGKPIMVAVDQVRGQLTANYPTPARRPLNSRLDTHKLRNTFGLTLPHWQTGVDRMLQEIL